MNTPRSGRSISTRALVVAGVLVALLLAGVVSYFASGSPDGLERVAGDKGFAESAKDHHTADSPMADYQTRGVDNDLVSGGVAGVVGSLLVLVLAGGLAVVVRRRSTGEGGTGSVEDANVEEGSADDVSPDPR